MLFLIWSIGYYSYFSYGGFQFFPIAYCNHNFYNENAFWFYKQTYISIYMFLLTYICKNIPNNWPKNMLFLVKTSWKFISFENSYKLAFVSISYRNLARLANLSVSSGSGSGCTIAFASAVLIFNFCLYLYLLPVNILCQELLTCFGLFDCLGRLNFSIFIYFLAITYLPKTFPGWCFFSLTTFKNDKLSLNAWCTASLLK